MDSRRTVYMVFAVGFTLILALTFAPYVMLSEARRVAAAASTIVKKVTRRPTAPTIEPPPEVVPVDIAAWYLGRGAEPATHGVLVESLDGKRHFGSYNADAPFNPASLVKLATTLAALRRLGPDYRFETRVYVEGQTDSAGVLRGRLYVAGDDPTFGDVAAVLIAEELRARGIKGVSEEVVVAPGFCFNYSNSPEESAERLARVAKLQPKKLGVGQPPTGRAPAFVLRSYPLRAILLYMNAHSNNFVAERVGDLVGGAAGVENFLETELRLAPDSVSLSTTSGLETNRMTPRGLLSVIRALDEEAGRRGLKLQDLLPVASDDWGTLRRRLKDTPLESAVVAKTGTLVHDDGGMSSIGGVAYTERSGAVGFVVLNQGSNVAENKQLTDHLLLDLILAHDTPLKLPQPERPRHMLRREDLIIGKW